MRGGGGGRIRKGQTGREAAKKSVCNELLPSDKSACRLFSPFSVLLVDFYFNVARKFPHFSFNNSNLKHLNRKFI